MSFWSHSPLFTTTQMTFQTAWQSEGEKVTLIVASFYGTIIFSLRHPYLPPSLLSLGPFSITPSLRLRSNIIWVQLTSLKSPGCFKHCELEGRQTQGHLEEAGGRRREGGGDEEGSKRRQYESQCHQCWEQRGVFDLTGGDSKALEPVLLLPVSCHCTVPCKDQGIL